MSWRDPVKALAVEEDVNKLVYLGDGRMRTQVNITVSKDDFERIRLGYVCLNCKEPHETPFPEQCSLCGYAMRHSQRTDLEQEFEGTKHVGPSTSLDYELDRLDDWSEREFWTPSGIVVPAGVRL